MLNIIKREVQLGSTLSIVLKTGREFVGNLSEIGDTYIILRSGNREMYLSSDMIGAWEVRQSLAGQESAEAASEGQSQPAATAPLSYPIEVVTQLLGIETRLNKLIQRAQPKPLPPNFAWPKDDFLYVTSAQRNEAQQEWTKLRNKYEYAVKIKDYSRLGQIALGYQDLLKKFPKLFQVHYNLGCLYLLLDRVREAFDAFNLAITKLKDPRAHYNLAMIALIQGDAAKTQRDLFEFFKQASPSQHLDAWYKFVSLTIRFNKTTEVVECFQAAILDQRNEDISLLLESLAFILKAQKRQDDAYQVLVLLKKERFETADVLALKSAFRRSRHKPASLEGNSSLEGIAEAESYPVNDEDARPTAATTSLPVSLDQKETAAPPETDAEVREDAPRKNSRGVFAQAKRALKSKSKTDKAEKLLRRAIAEGDHTEAALQELVSLLLLTKRGLEAVHLLRQYEHKVDDTLTLNNLLAVSYQSIGKHNEAISVFYKVLSLTPERKQYVVRNHIALSQIKIGDISQARETLKLVRRSNPDDITSRDLLALLDDHNQIDASADLSMLARETFNSKPADLLDYNSSTSKFLKFYLDHCDYIGVPDAANRNFSEEDIIKLNELIDAAGRGRGLRPQYNLSVARLLMDLKSGNEQQFRSHMQEYAAEMGDISLSDLKPKDVVFAYYLEAFGITPKLTPKLKEKLSQLIMLFCTIRGNIIVEKPPELETSLETVLGHAEYGRALVEWLLQISLLNSQVDKFLFDKIDNKAYLLARLKGICEELIERSCEPVNNSDELKPLWSRARERVREKNAKIIEEFIHLQKRAEKLDSLEDQIERVRQLGTAFRVGSLDQERLRRIGRLLSKIFEYTKQPLYIDAERLATIVRKDISDFMMEIRDEPTKYSLELFYPYIQTLDKTIEEHFDKIQQAAEPDQLETDLEIRSYIPDPDLNIDCQITISNLQGKSPASDVKIEVDVSPSQEYALRQHSILVTQALHGGEVVTCQIPIRVTPKAVQSQVFTLYYRLSYNTRAGKQIQTTDKIPIELNSASDFRKIDPNPYAPWAEAQEVTDPKMFYGRDQLVENLLSAIRNSPESKSLVIYGQKRAGKSSVLYHLNEKLELPIIPVKFSLGEIVNNLSITTFLYKIIQRLDVKFEDFYVKKGLPLISIERPSLTEFEKNPELRFQDYLLSLRRAMRQIPEYQGARVILLIDEFTYVYGEIKRNRIPDNFMKFWKALLQQGYFGSVLVGQDIMRQFIDSFPNEFQVAQSERISYLQFDDAQKLIVDPIRIPETLESRFKGAAVNRIIELTAGSPFYIQIFCNRLVEYMNRKKLMRVTDAHIEQVKIELIKGNNSLTKDKFDNLISAGDDATNMAPSEDVRAVLHDIAVGSRTQECCDQHDINAPTSIPLNIILDDLVRREVLERHVSSPEVSEKQRTARYKIRVGLFKEWLLSQ